ncbi:hypothetical protein [Ruegeria arenilitoris]|uniref:hypothetical protein n=1 Tax=Ruegeria arenilitoris TaxID=1173585 RepID=UPI00147D2ACB|nr:hypothetical protein [Ruegeria arenilitoris]
MPNIANGSNVIPFPTAKGVNPCVRPDLSHYEDHLRNFDLTSKQRKDFLDALWILLSGFIDLGYGLHPTQFPDVPNDFDATTLGSIKQQFKDAA